MEENLRRELHKELLVLKTNIRSHVPVDSTKGIIIVDEALLHNLHSMKFKKEVLKTNYNPLDQVKEKPQRSVSPSTATSSSKLSSRTQWLLEVKKTSPKTKSSKENISPSTGFSDYSKEQRQYSAN